MIDKSSLFNSNFYNFKNRLRPVSTGHRMFTNVHQPEPEPIKPLRAAARPQSFYYHTMTSADQLSSFRRTGVTVDGVTTGPTPRTITHHTKFVNAQLSASIRTDVFNFAVDRYRRNRRVVLEQTSSDLDSIRNTVF